MLYLLQALELPVWIGMYLLILILNNRASYFRNLIIRPEIVVCYKLYLYESKSKQKTFTFLILT